MDDYPSNSHNKKQPAKDTAKESKNVEKIVAGNVVRRKKTIGRRFKEVFGDGDGFFGVFSYITFDVLIPAAKDTIVVAVEQGIERMVFGEVRGNGMRRGHRTFDRYQQPHTPYNRYSTNGGRRDVQEPRFAPSRRARANHDFDDIILDTRVEADEVIEKLYYLVDKYESATVADLYELIGIDASFTDGKWGWTDLHGADVERTKVGYLLNLPRPEPID